MGESYSLFQTQSPINQDFTVSFVKFAYYVPLPHNLNKCQNAHLTNFFRFVINCNLFHPSSIFNIKTFIMNLIIHCIQSVQWEGAVVVL